MLLTLRLSLLLTTLGLFALVCSQNCSNFETGGHRCFSGDCIEISEICDGKADCPDASDETTQLCNEIWCPGYSFRCSYGACIASTAVCDGKPDCIDGSDEQRWLCRAQMQQAICDNGEFYCYPGQCLPFHKLCDNKADCLNGEDEGDSLCEGVSTSTTPRTTTEEMSSNYPIYSSISLEEEKSVCVIPQISQVIIQNKTNDAVLQVGSNIPYGTVIYFACPADHVLKGVLENRCEGPKWLQQFPYCEAPTSWALFVIIGLIVIIILILISYLYIFKKKDNKQQEEHIWLVESSNAQTNVEKV